MRKLLNISGVIVATVATVFVGFFGSARDSWEKRAKELKTDYIYLESVRQEALDNIDGDFELLRRTYDRDTTDTYVGRELAMFYLALSERDPEFIKTSHDLAARRFSVDPSDQTNALLYGRIAEQYGYNDEALVIWKTLDSIYPDRDDYKIRYVDALLGQRDSACYVSAIDEIAKMEQRLGASSQLTSRAVYAQMQFNDTTAAVNSIRRLLEMAPRIADNYVYAGRFFLSVEKPDSAIKYFDKACEVDSTSGYAYYTRADYYRQTNDSVAFNRETTHALLYTDLDIDVKNEIMLNYVREFYNDSTQESRIDSLFKQVIERNPHEYSFREMYASYLATIKRFKEAAEQSDMALDIDPGDPQMWTSSIAYHSLSDDNDGAIAIAERAVAVHPEEVKIYQLYGSTLTTADRNEEAIATLQKGIEVCDSLDYVTMSELLSTIGDIYYKMEQSDNAFEYYDKALNVYSGNVLAMNNMAYYLSCEDKDLEKAEKLSLATIREEPDNPTYLDTYAWIMFKMRDYAKAKEYIDRALEHEPEPTSELYEHAGDIYFLNGDPEQGVEYWRKAHELDPDNALLAKKLKNKGYFYE